MAQGGRITADALSTALRSGTPQVVVLDVRRLRERLRDGAIPGSVHVPADEASAEALTPVLRALLPLEALRCARAFYCVKSSTLSSR